tara:strand:- start:2540 stop:4543 length:2004 start_codon:yes stop_codon:yes gene_type:complete
MNPDDLKNIFEINNLNTGIIQGVYNFESGSECLVFNDYYPTGAQVISGDVTRPISETFPLVAISCTSNVTGNLGSSGVFKGEDVLELASDLSTGNWTFFVDYYQSESTQGNVARVLASSMETYTGASGFNFGVNGSNRAYFEYLDTGNQRRIYTHPKELGENNVISVSQSSNVLTIINHDIGSFDHEVAQFRLENFTESSYFFIGNFGTTGSSTPSSYTGFSGQIDSFILYGGALNPSQQNTIAENYFYSGIESGTTVAYSITGQEITGVDVNLTGLTGTGVTGFIPQIYKTIETCLCGDINFYKDSGVSGELFGQVVEFLTGSGIISGSGFSGIGAQRTNDYSKSLKYAEQCISFIDEIDTGNYFEIYSHTSFYDTQLNITPEFLGDNNYYPSTGYEGGNLNVFLNGLAKYSGDQFSITTDTAVDYKVKFDDLPSSGQDAVVFDIISGDQNIIESFSGYAVTGIEITNSGGGYTGVPSVVFSGGENAAATAFTGEAGGTVKVTGLVLTSGGSGFLSSPTITIEGGGATTSATASGFIDQENFTISNTHTGDIYLNGYKLLSGVDFTGDASEISLISSQIQNNNKYVTGNILVLPRISESYNRITGNASQFINAGVGLIDEQVWVNGKRIEEDSYFKVSNVGLLKYNNFVTGFNTNIYNNTNDFFDT